MYAHLGMPIVTEKEYCQHWKYQFLDQVLCMV